MELNFFQWLRNSIRQTVLLGVSDAMKTIGAPDEEDELHPQMVAMIENSPVASTPKVTSRAKTTNSRKRLGKSLKELNPEAAKK
ncbi:MAG: hypothetical protein AAF958_19110 [Planctomycetota bacterium]